MAEQIILDPSERAEGRTALDITPWLTQDGIDWGDASIEAYMSEAQRGNMPVDFRVPNREVSGGLTFRAVGGTTATQIRTKVQAKLALFQREGGWIKRVTNGGGTVYADVVNASFRATSVPGYESRDDIDTGASFSLECLPDFYGDEQDLGDNSTTTAAELIFTETGIEGDYPGRCRIVVDEDDNDDQRGLIWAFRSRHYSSATTASMEYEAEELENLDTATKTAGTAIYGTATSSMWSGSTIVHHGTLSTSWTPVLGTNLGGSTHLTHTGSNQVFARVASTSGTTVAARFVWDVGDLVNPVENPEWRFPAGGTTTATQPFIADLGEIRLDPAPVGTHRWRGQVQFRGDSGGETASVDKLWIVNKDEGMGVLTSPFAEVEGLGAYISRSNFTTESGALNGDSLLRGGTWTTSGDATDFVESSDEAVRSEVSDAANTGRFARAGSSTTANVVVKTNLKFSAYVSVRCGVFARYTDSNNYLLAFATPGATVQAFLVKRVGGTNTTLAGVSVSNPLSYYMTLELRVVGNAASLALTNYNGTRISADAVITDTALASGGHGLYDENTTASAITRTYDEFSVVGYDGDAVMYAGQSAQLTTDGMYREDSGGVAYGPVSKVIGDLPRIPVAGLEGRTTEVFLKGSRGDLDELSDTSIDDISARVSYRPSWLFVDDT